VQCISDPQNAAEQLLRYAKRAAKDSGLAALKDDTTIVVVDVNPSRLGILARHGPSIHASSCAVC
jgi:phage replication-related protein YjqB (UPF0714/DUF867 family)